MKGSDLNEEEFQNQGNILKLGKCVLIVCWIFLFFLAKNTKKGEHLHKLLIKI